MVEIAILLSTYNGEKYLEEQLMSLLSQTNKMWKCYIRDDRSNDKTQQIIDKYIQNYPQKFQQFFADKNMGPAQSFMSLLLDYSYDEKYFMFCDQDDVWKENKIEKTLEKMREFEDGGNKAILVHSDLEVVDENLVILHTSMKQSSKLNPRNTKIENLILQNNITGCTVMINDCLRREIKKDKNIIMHDWWIAMIASICGEIKYINDSLILYRQHSSNSIGAKEGGFSKHFKKIFAIHQSIAKYRSVILRYKKQLYSLQNLYNKKIDKNNLENISMILNGNKASKLKWFISKNYSAQSKMNTFILKFMYFIFD